jgi:2-C-methyl-D-erythritol 4-phosphate cytidylyltransferase
MARGERVGVIVPAAGDGRRLGAPHCKALVALGERPLLAWTLAGIQANGRVDSVVVVAHPASIEAVASLVAAGGFARVSAVVTGGPTRRASVAAGLDALPAGPAYVAVHDACRPLLRPGAIDRLADLLGDLAPPAIPGAAARGPGHLGGRGTGARGPGPRGVAPGVAVTDTVRRVAGGGRSGGIVDREELRTLQTPQIFLRAALEEAHRRAAAGGLDDLGSLDRASDAVLLERAGFPVAVVPGELENLTIATPLDLEVAAVLASRAARDQGAP